MPRAHDAGIAVGASRLRSLHGEGLKGGEGAGARFVHVDIAGFPPVATPLYSSILLMWNHTVRQYVLINSLTSIIEMSGSKWHFYVRVTGSEQPAVECKNVKFGGPRIPSQVPACRESLQSYLDLARRRAAHSLLKRVWKLELSPRNCRIISL